MRTSDEAPFSGFLGIEFTALEPERIEARLLVRRELTNRAGNLHGGAIMALADHLGGTATVVNLPEGTMTVTLESKTNFLNGVREGETVTAESVPLHRGRTTMVWQTTIRRADGKTAAIVTQTQLVMPKRG